MTTTFPKETTFIKFGNIADYTPDAAGRVTLNVQGVLKTTVTTASPTASGWSVSSLNQNQNGVLQYEDPNNPGTFIKMLDGVHLNNVQPSVDAFYTYSGGSYVRNNQTYNTLKDAGTLGNGNTYVFDKATGEPLVMGITGAANYIDDYAALDANPDQLGGFSYTALFLTPDGEILMAYGDTENTYSGQNFRGVTDYYTLEDNINAWAAAGIEWGMDVDANSWDKLSNQDNDANGQSGAGHDFFGGDVTVVCFTQGTLISTSTGQVPVESLSEGDLVLTKDNGFQPIRWTGSRKLSHADLESAPKLRPIRIKAGALGQSTPESDLTVSPQHRILIRSQIARRMFNSDEVLIAAKHLLDTDGIEVVEDMKDVEYFHILFDQHELVFANGAEAESLYLGEQAFNSLSATARDEIFTLFPELQEEEFYANRPTVRPFVSGRMARKLGERARKNKYELVC